MFASILDKTRKVYALNHNISLNSGRNYVPVFIYRLILNLYMKLFRYRKVANQSRGLSLYKPLAKCGYFTRAASVQDVHRRGFQLKKLEILITW
jgi:hypothetical protein